VIVSTASTSHTSQRPHGLLEAYRRGCLFDNWNEKFLPDVWSGLLQTAPAFSPEDELPWDRWVDSGITRAFLKREWEKAVHGEFSPSCRTSCLACGLGRAGEDIRLSEKFRVESAELRVPGRQEEVQSEELKVESPDRSNPEAISPSALLTPNSQLNTANSEPKVRYSLHVTKTGPARWLSYRNYANFVVEALMRAGVPLSFTAGFNPRPILHLAPALPVGIASRDEIVEIACRREVEWREVSLGAPGIVLRAAEALDPQAPALSRRLTSCLFLLDGAPMVFFPGDTLKTHDPLRLEKVESRLTGT